MRIKKLEIFGFKSFKDRTVIQFDHGITGVVGPNGCGKSNIVDALVWVMGEMSAKHLRGSSMEDVIFAGSEDYAPMGLAEVSLILENDGGPFPAQYMNYTELMVTRRLHRSGESEYLINKEPARLRDIQEIFMDTGAGAKGFSIIEQGAIGKIVTAKPDDRRMLIEEAAGITKFKARKRESQRKLESTDQNLVRLQDIIGEQKRQIESLERQAQRAERYRKIKTELQEKDLWLASHQYLKIHEESSHAEQEFNAAREIDIGSESRVAELEARLAALRAEKSEKDALVQDKQLQHRQLVKHVQETEFRIRELNMSIEQARRSNDLTGSMVAQFNLRRENLLAEKEKLDLQLIETRENVLRLESEFNQKNESFLELQKAIQQMDQELTDKRREMLAVSASGSHFEAKFSLLNSRLEDELKKQAETQKEQYELQTKKSEFSSRRNKVFADLERERQMQMDHTKDVDLLTQNLTTLRTNISEKRSELENFKDELNQVSSRLYGLEDLQSNFEGFEDGVKSVLMWQRAKPEEAANKFQPLSEMVEVPERYELAMEASLGTRLQLLLSDSSDQAVGAVDFLKSQKSGRSSFLSGDMSIVTETPTIEMATLKSEPGFETFLKDVVSVPENVKSHIAQFFSGIAIVDSIRTALRLRALHPKCTFVTLEGDTLSADGVLTGGAADSADTGVLRRRREIKSLSLKREELSGKVQLAQLYINKQYEQESGLSGQLEIAKKSAVEKEILIAELRKDLERAEIELGNVTNAYDFELKQSEKVEKEITSLREALTELTKQIESSQIYKNEIEAKIQGLTTDYENSRRRVDENSNAVTELKINVAAKKQELESTERELILLQATISDVESQLKTMSEETERNSNTLTSSQITVENLQTELQRVIHQAKEAELSVAQLCNIFEMVQSNERKVEGELSQTMHDLNQIRARMSETQIHLEQFKLKETYLVEHINDRYMINLRDIASQYREQSGDIEQFSKDTEELREKLKRIGEVNLSAIQEYDEVKTRYEFLSQQHTDLLEAKEHLNKVIDRINRICSRRFKETFEQVNGRFRQVFPVLFGGGEASLQIIEDVESGEHGIDIIAQPPGKKMQSVTLLSGGEKALTAVSLIFSIFLVKPSPFCLLDEVDAPLDDANVMRFNDLVKEMARRSQIIVVTHNKHTMKVNDKLYGVTMQEKGVSKMVSVSLADAEKLAQTLT